MPRRYNKKTPYNRKRGYSKRYKKGFKPIGSVNKLYRNPNPRTLQIATRRNTSQVLRFVTNQCYKVVPGGNVGGMENVFLRFAANSIYDMTNGTNGNGSLNAPGTWTPQDSTKYGPSITTQNATGWDEWVNRYAQFTVLGSRIQVTYEPYGVEATAGAKQVPTTVYINLAGNESQIGSGTQMTRINELPYTKRASIIPNLTNSIQSGALSTGNSANAGVRLFHNYSAKKFEGVSDVADNDQLKGAMLTAPLKPAEQSWFTVGLRNTIPSTAADERMPQGILRVKLEYITLLTEPSSTNYVQAPAITNFEHI